MRRMRIYLLIRNFDKAGGAEEQLAVTGIELQKLGHYVTVFSQYAVPSNNQYVRRLVESCVPVVAWPDNIVKLVGDWHFQDLVIRSITHICYPGLLLVALIVALLRCKPIKQIWRSTVGRWQGILARIIHKNRLDTLLLSTLALYCRWRRPDILHVFREDMHVVLGWAQQKHLTSIYYELGTPGVGDFITLETWKYRSTNLRKASLVAAISESTARELRRVVKVDRPIRVIKPFLAEVPQNTAVNTHRNGPLTITCIARLCPEKGLSDLLTAAKQVLAQRPSIKFVIAGDGPLRETLMQQAKQLCIADRVTFYGAFPRKDLHIIMADTDVFVLPSLYEGLPLSIIEAMAYGKPVVSTSVCGIPEAVDHQSTGLLVPPMQPDCLAAALLTLVDDESLRLQMGTAGRKKFETENYTVESYIKSTLSAYSEAISLADTLHGEVNETPNRHSP